MLHDLRLEEEFFAALAGFDAEIAVHATWVGNWCTSLEMAGASVTCMHLDPELTTMLDHPCDCAMFRVV